MATLLIINSSPRSNSVSRKLTAQAAAQWKAANPAGRVIERDLSDGSIPYLSEPWIEAAYTPEAARTPAQRAMLELSDTLIDEVLAADVILLGVPMHNFSVPATFKAWIDQISRAGKTFSYGDQGPKGLGSREQASNRHSLARWRLFWRGLARSGGFPGLVPSPGARFDWTD